MSRAIRDPRRVRRESEHCHGGTLVDGTPVVRPSSLWLNPGTVFGTLSPSEPWRCLSDLTVNSAGVIWGNAWLLGRVLNVTQARIANFGSAVISTWATTHESPPQNGLGQRFFVIFS